jgi:hypothetical protein
MIAACAGGVAAVCAAGGLIFSGLQTRQATASRDFDTLTGLFDQMQNLESRLSAAASVADNAQVRAVSTQLLNWVELLIVSLDKKLIGPASREFAGDLVIEVLAMLDLYDFGNHLDGQLTGDAYRHTSSYMARHRAVITKRKNDMAAQDVSKA